MYKLNKWIIYILIAILSIFSIANITHALTFKDALPGGSITGTFAGSSGLGYTSPETYLKTLTGSSDLGVAGATGLIFALIASVLIYVSPIFAILMLYGGFLWMTAAGKEDQVTKGRKFLVNATIGLVIVLGVNVIGSFISTQIFNALAKSKVDNTQSGTMSVPAGLQQEVTAAQQKKVQQMSQCTQWLNRTLSSGSTIEATLASPFVAVAYEVCAFTEIIGLQGTTSSNPSDVTLPSGTE